MTRSREEDVTDLLEMLTQEYFDNICSRLAQNKTIRASDLAIIKSTLGPITYRNFLGYIESTGEYDLSVG